MAAPVLFITPKKIQAGKVFLYAEECGGRQAVGPGKATIICGENGARLKPFWCGNKGKINVAHAKFTFVKFCVTVECEDGQNVTITKHELKVDKENQLVTVVSHKLFFGTIDKLVDDQYRFVGAARAANWRSSNHCYRSCYVYRTRRHQQETSNGRMLISRTSTPSSRVVTTRVRVLH